VRPYVGEPVAQAVKSVFPRQVEAEEDDVGALVENAGD